MSYQTNTNFTVAANDLVGALKERAQLAASYFSDVEKAVVKATNRDIVSPKQKHVRNIALMLQDRTLSAAELTKLLQDRVKEGSWIVVFKTLILIHILLNEDSNNSLMSYLGTHIGLVNMSAFRDSTLGAQGLEQSKNIKVYASYLEERILSYRDLDFDLVQELDKKNGKRLAKDWKKLSVQLPSIERMMDRLLSAQYFLDSINNEITTESVRLLVVDLMKLFQCYNEAITNILKEFFTLQKKDGLQALEHYKRFAQNTDKVREFFAFAKKMQFSLPVQIPEVKHVPVSLSQTLTNYLNSPDFEQQRLSKAAGSRDVIAESQGSLNRSASSNNFVNVFSGADANKNSQSNPSNNQQTKPTANLNSVPPAANVTKNNNVQSDLLNLDFLAPANPQPQVQKVGPSSQLQSLNDVFSSPVSPQQQQIQQIQQLAAMAYQQPKLQPQQQMATPMSYAGSFAAFSPNTVNSQQSNMVGYGTPMMQKQSGYALSPAMSSAGAFSQPMMPSQKPFITNPSMPFQPQNSTPNMMMMNQNQFPAQQQTQLFGQQQPAMFQKQNSSFQ